MRALLETLQAIDTTVKQQPYIEDSYLSNK
jgi:hypothetical protein